MTDFTKCFVYTKEPPSPTTRDCLVVEIPNGIHTVEELFTTIDKGLRLPSYFGRNWSALSDCLRDLHWVQERSVEIWHRDMPHLPEADAVNYLSVLAEAALDWQEGEVHSLKVFFPEPTKNLIQKLVHVE